MVGTPSAVLLHSAWPILIGHDVIAGDLQLVLQLFSTSKAVRGAVLEHCKGLLSIKLVPNSEQHIQQVTAWMSKYVQLIGSITLDEVSDMSVDGRGRLHRLAERKLSEALQGKQDNVQVHQLQHHIAGPAADQLLNNLAGSSLHTLHLSTTRSALHKWGISPNSSDCSINSSTIAAFSKLRSLHIDLENEELRQPLTPVLAGLTGLKELFLYRQYSEAGFEQLQQELPGKLTGLTLLAYQEQEAVNGRFAHLKPLRQPLQLSRLHNLLLLEVLNVMPGSQLPVGLLHLECIKCPSTQPLLACKQLQILHLTGDISIRAHGLQQLSALTALADLGTFKYGPTDPPLIADASAAAWSVAPVCSAVKGLQVQVPSGRTLAAHTLQQMRHLQGLTMLHICCFNTRLLATPQEFADVLQCLTGLNQLEVFTGWGRHLLLPEPRVPAADDIEGVVNVIMGALVDEGAEVAELATDADAVAAVVAGIAVVVGEEGEAVNAANVAAAIVQHNPAAALHLHQGWNIAPFGDPPAAEDDRAPNMLPVTEAIAQLPHLDSLKLQCTGLSVAAVKPLKQATQLTRLTISGKDFTDTALITLVQSLTGLQRLSINGSTRITDSSMAVVGHNLQQLTELELSNCSGISDATVGLLEGLTNLQMFEADDSGLTDEGYDLIKAMVGQNVAALQ